MRHRKPKKLVHIISTAFSNLKWKNEKWLTNFTKLEYRIGALSPIFPTGESRNEVKAPPVLENSPGRGYLEAQV